MVSKKYITVFSNMASMFYFSKLNKKIIIIGEKKKKKVVHKSVELGVNTDFMY